jgi:hypothetical protein
MERVGVLITKLQEQYQQNADPAQILMTVQMLVKELQAQPVNGHQQKITVIYPNASYVSHPSNNVERNISPVSVEEIIKQVEAPKEIIVEEKNAEPELNEAVASRPAYENSAAGFLNKWYGDPGKEIPTLLHQTKQKVELNQSMATEDENLNDKLRVEKIELASVLKDAPIRDLKKAIGINERYLFINELFRGDETSYERSIKTINDFNIFAEAEYWIKRELKLKFAWNDTNATVKQFDQLVRRRFS